MSHTPGPWEIEYCDEDGDFYENGVRIISPEGPVAFDVIDCSAHLISSAPTLLAILKEVRDAAKELDDENANWRTLDATYVDSIISGIWRVSDLVIAKAEGRSDG